MLVRPSCHRGPLTFPRRLIKTTVETVRTRLDRIYLETLVAHALAPPPPHSFSSPTADAAAGVRATQDEIDSLYLEILPVAQMAAEQQHLEPALRAVAHGGATRAGRSEAAVGHVSRFGVFFGGGGLVAGVRCFWPWS
jgi:hypothetical protein